VEGARRVSTTPLWTSTFLTGALLLCLVGCQSGPTLEDARDLLRHGEGAEALEAARLALAEAPPEQQEDLRRIAFEAGLQAGWSHEAALEYLELRGLLGRDDPRLLLMLARGSLRLGLETLSPSRRMRAVQVMERLSPGEVEGLLAQASQDREPEVRAAAVRAVLIGHDPTQALAHARLALEDTSPTVRYATLRAMAEALDQPASPLASANANHLLELPRRGLGDGDPAVRLEAVRLIAALIRREIIRPDHPALVPSLSPLVRNGSAPVARAATRILLDLGFSEASATWLAATGQGPTEQAFAAALACDGDPAADGAMRALLASRSYSSKLGALQGLGASAAPRFQDQLLGLARDDPAAPIRHAAIGALVRGAVAAPAVSESVHTGLQGLVEHGHSATRQRALEGLYELASTAGDPTREQGWDAGTLVGLLSDPTLASWACDRLARRPDGLSHLLDALARPRIRLAALRALARSPHLGRVGARGRALFLALLADDEPRVRAEAALGLVRCALPDDRLVLVSSLCDQTDDADLSAAAALLALEGRGRAGLDLPTE
jgi:hypothetical protein